MKFQSFLNFAKKITEIIKMFLHFLIFYLLSLSFFFSDFTSIKRPYVSLYSHFHYAQNINFGSMFEYIRQKLKRKYAHLIISSRDEVFTRPFSFFSSRDEISSWKKRVNSKRHFTIQTGMISSRDKFHPRIIFHVETRSNKNFICKKNLYMVQK